MSIINTEQFGYEVNRNTNIAWISANRLGYELLHEIMALKGVNVKSIITLSYDSPVKMYDYPTHPCFPEIKKEAYINEWDTFGIPCLYIKRIYDAMEKLREMNLDYIFVVGWREKISKEILDIPRKGCIGFHPTALPYGRGSAPIINSILHDLHTSALTMFYLSEGLDDGDIIGMHNFFIESNDYTIDIYNKVITVGRELIRKYIPMMLNDSTPRLRQDESKAFVLPMLSHYVNEINGTDSIDLAYKKIRAFSHPYDGAYILRDGKKLIIWRADK